MLNDNKSDDVSDNIMATIKVMTFYLVHIVKKIAVYFIYSAIVFIMFMGALMLYYHEFLPYPIKGLSVALYSIFSLYILWRFYQSRHLKWLLLFFLFFMGIFFYYAIQKPMHERNWRGDMIKLSRVEFIDKDTVNITNFRNFEYQSVQEYEPIYTERVVHLSDITSIDFYISYWMPGPIAHTFLSFNIKDAEPVSISIEARYQEHEKFNPLASLFREFEIIYVVGDERDLVRVRTNFRNEAVYRYPLHVPADSARLLFLAYAERINQLYEQPEFYHLLSNSCTVNIARYANQVGRTGGFDFRLLFNGLSDRYLYNNEYVDTTLPFSTLRELAYINDLAEEADDSREFSRIIRQRLPSME